MASQHIQNGQNMFSTLFSIHHLLKCTPSYMFHIDQFWCTPWHDSINPTTLRSGTKGIDSQWWINSTHNNWHTFRGSHPSSWRARSEHQLETWNVKWTPFWNYHQGILEALQVCLVTNYRWIWMEVVILPQDEWWNHIIDAWARCLHFFCQTHLVSWYWEEISCGHGSTSSEGRT
jgi:hypothetical protein